MIKKYQTGSWGKILGSVGGAGDGSSGGTGQGFDLSGLIDPYFMGLEYLHTLNGVNKQLRGMKGMLHSLPAPSSAPEVFTAKPNYNVLDQQYTDAEAKLHSTPILGSSVDQHIAQQQAIGEQTAALEHQKIQALSQMRNADLAQSAKDDYQNAASRHQTAEERHVFDMGIKQQIQDNEDAATAIKTDAIKKFDQELYSLAKMKELKENRRALAEMQREYYKKREETVRGAEDAFNQSVDQNFRNQFTADLEMEDLDEFQNKYGIDREQYQDDESAMYDSEEYKAALDAYKLEQQEEWIKRKNQIMTSFDDQWWIDNGDRYYSYMKRGGKVASSKSNTLSKNDRIAIDNNRELHDFVKQMNQKQKEIFLKLMSL